MTLGTRIKRWFRPKITLEATLYDALERSVTLWSMGPHTFFRDVRGQQVPCCFYGHLMCIDMGGRVPSHEDQHTWYLQRFGLFQDTLGLSAGDADDLLEGQSHRRWPDVVRLFKLRRGPVWPGNARLAHTWVWRLDV